MKELIVLITGLAPFWILWPLTWLGVPLGNSGSGGLIMLPLLCLITVPVSLIVAAIICFRRFM